MHDVNNSLIWLMYFVYVYEKRTMKLAEFVLRREEEGMRENDGGGEPN
jgi:hypothetical protein